MYRIIENLRKISHNVKLITMKLTAIGKCFFYEANDVNAITVT